MFKMHQEIPLGGALQIEKGTGAGKGDGMREPVVQLSKCCSLIFPESQL